MTTKGPKFKQWTSEEKFKIIKPIIKLEKSSKQITKETGINNGMITHGFINIEKMVWKD
jgi:hypothetical protein